MQKIVHRKLLNSKLLHNLHNHCRFHKELNAIKNVTILKFEGDLGKQLKKNVSTENPGTNIWAKITEAKSDNCRKCFRNI